LMARGEKEDFEKEFERCLKLYSGFEEAEEFLRQVFNEVFGFLERKKSISLVDHFPLPEKERTREDFKNGKSLEYKPRIKAEEILELLHILCDVFIRVNPGLEETVKKAKERFESFLKTASEFVEFKKIKQLWQELEQENLLENDLLNFLFINSLSAIYKNSHDNIIEDLPKQLWEEGHCCLCGEKPHYGLLRYEDGAKILECWLCGTRWGQMRIKCPFCSNETPEELGYFTVEDNKHCRIQFCNKCKTYYKLIDARELGKTRKIVLPLHHLATLSHDLLAEKEGFLPGSGLRWVNNQDKNL